MAPQGKLEVTMGRTPAQSFGDRARAEERKLARQARRAAGLELRPGPAPKPAADRLSHPMTILLTNALREAIGEAAYADRQSLGDWVRAAIITALATR